MVVSPLCGLGFRLWFTWRHYQISKWIEFEHARWDPKDNELCLRRMKLGETLVEVRSGADVQIVRQTWV